MTNFEKIILHIGTHKTASTSIQEWCYDNQPALLEEGFYYPTVHTHWKGHHSLAWATGVYHPTNDEQPDATEIIEAYKTGFTSSVCSKNGSEESNEQSGEDGGSDEPGEETSEDINLDLSGHTLLLSSEDFEFMSPPKIKFLKNQLQGQDYKIILYLRDPLKYLISDYQQNVRDGRKRYSRDLMTFFVQFNLYYRLAYCNTYNRWAGAFGEENIIVMDFEEEKTHIINSFLSAIGSSLSTEDNVQANVGLSQLSIACLARMNGTYPLAVDQHNKVVQTLYEIEKDFPADLKMKSLLDNEIANHILSNLRDNYAQLQKKSGRCFNWTATYDSLLPLQKEEIDLSLEQLHHKILSTF